MRSRFGRSVCGLLTLSIIVAACGDDGGAEDAGGATSGTGSSAVVTTTTEKAPQSGGTLVFGQWSPVTTLDPTMASGYGTSGGIEIGAIYDRLIEWNPVTKKYDPKTAESFVANADSTIWTLKIRPNIKFADGTAYDAAAVKLNVERQKQKNTNTRGLLATVTDMTVVDPLTLRFTLSEGWGGFPIVFNNSAGMIVSPAAITALGDQGLMTNPVNAGAGPFQIDSFKPGEAIVLKKNPNYWGGTVYLDAVRFVTIAGAVATYDAMTTGTLHAAFLRDAVTITKAKAAGVGSADSVVSGGEMIILNIGTEVTCAKEAPAPFCVGQADGAKVPTNPATKDPKVRQAIAAALDVKAIDDRMNGGSGIPATSLLDASYPWDPKVPMPGYDVERARKLVTEAKAAGWNGKVRFTCGTEDQQRTNESLAVQTLLKSAGIEVDATRAAVKVSEQIADVITTKNFDLACWGLQNTPDDNGAAQLEQFLRSTSGSNRTGYKSTAMDAALTEMKAAGSDQARVAATKKVAELWSTDLPGIPILHTAQGVFWTSKVHGIKGTGLSAASLDKAWIEQ